MEHTWRNLESLTRWLRRLLYLGVVIDLLSLANDVYQRNVFRQLIAQGVVAAKATTAADHAGVWVSGFVSDPLACLGLAIAILAAVWIYRAAANARALGAPDLTISPGWAVGWYFIPIANCWKPYQAMREIWQASARLQPRPDAAKTALLRTWWALWLLRFFVPWIILIDAGMKTHHGGITEGWMLSSAAQTVGSLIDMPLTLVFALLIGTIWRMQSNHVAPPSSSLLVAGVPSAMG